MTTSRRTELGSGGAPHIGDCGGGDSSGEDDCWLTAHRVGKRHYPHEIAEEIVRGLHQCDMVVADVTHARSVVYFEAGYGMVLGRPLIFCVRRDHFDADVNFDTLQYPHIVWADEADLRTKRGERLEGLLARAGRR